MNKFGPGFLASVMAEAEMRRKEESLRAEPDAPAQVGKDSSVKASFTPKRRSKRPRKDVETMDYLGAARRFIRAAGRRVGESDEHELRELLALRGVLETAIADAVAGQREYGKSWAAIARGTGATREAAFQKWGRANAGI